MANLREITLVHASVATTATFAEAAQALSEARLPALAVLDGERVVGLFTDRSLLSGLFPSYLGDLRHTAFLEGDSLLSERAIGVRNEPVTKHMRPPVTLEIETSTVHAAERFLHCEDGAVAILEDKRYVGMLSRSELSNAVLRRLTES